MQTTNPALRLLEIIDSLLAADQDGPSRRAWAQALRVPETDTARITAGIAEVFGLINETKATLRALPDIEHDLYLASFPAIERLLNVDNISNGWSNYRRELVLPHVLQGLRFCAAELRKSCPEPLIDSSALESLAADVAAAIGEISKDTSVPASLRSLLLEHLQSIQLAIANYRIRGAATLKASIERAIGGLIAHKKLLDGQRESRGVTRFIGVVQKATDMMESAQAFAKSGFGLATAIREGIKLFS